MSGKRRALSLLLLTALLLPARANAAPETEGAEPAVTAAHAILVECETGRVLYERNADTRAAMASTTKIMTALLAIERCPLDELVIVPEDAPAAEGSKAYVAGGERIKLSDLLYALMLVSGNDAAVSIASHVAGSTEEFAALMNARARELGCTSTNFINPHGLPDDAHYTTARELARIAAAAMQNETFRTVVGTTYHETASGDRARTFKNKNKVLWQYDGGCGVKTGFTKAAGRCLVFAAERGGMTLVGCVLNAPDMWADAFALLDYGFLRVSNTLLVEAARPIASVAVEGARKKTLAVYPNCDILYPMATDDGDAVDWQLTVEARVRAPVRAGARVGELTLLVNGEAVRTVELIVTEGAERESLLGWIWEIVGHWAA